MTRATMGVARRLLLVLVVTLAVSSGNLARAADEAAAADEPALEPAAAPEAPAEATPPVDAEAVPDDEDDLGGLEEIVVTAEKRATRLQDTPAAISAFTSVDMAAAGIENVGDLTMNVPNFHYGVDQGASRITIRGISSSAGDQATAFHIDGIYQNNALFAEGLTFYDLERIEVLRGPQGTLFGRNATGGSVNVISKRPSYNVEMFGDAQFGTYDLIQSRGVLNVPIVNDVLAFRGSALVNQHRGYQRNEATTDRSLDRDDARQVAFRGQLRTNPIDGLEVLVRGTYLQDTARGFALKKLGPFETDLEFPGADLGNLVVQIPVYETASPNPADARRIFLNTTGLFGNPLKGNRTENWGVNSEINWEIRTLPVLGDTHLKMLGSHQELDVTQNVDMDHSDVVSIAVNALRTGKESVAEAHWASANEGAGGLRGDIRWLIGGFYLRAEKLRDAGVATLMPIRLKTTTGTIIAQARVGIPVFQYREDVDQSAAVYGQVDWENPFGLVEGLTVTGGLRYTRDWKQSFLDNSQILARVRSFELCLSDEIVSDKSKSWDAVSGKLGLKYDIRDAHNVYLNFSPGYKAGTIEHPVSGSGFSTTGCPENVDVPNAEPEKIYAFELGSKNRFFDNKLQANLTAFVYLYDDLQQVTFHESVETVTNAAEARVWGLEGEFAAMPIDDLSLIANVSYLNTEYVSFPDGRLSEFPGEVFDFTGNDLIKAPTYTLSLIGQYTLDLDRFGSITPRIQWFLSDEFFFRSSNLPVIDRQPSYQRLNLRLTWRGFDDDVFVEGFVDNVFDEDVFSYHNVGNDLLGSPIEVGYEPPRTAGVRFGISF